jgi:ActR/RegA family two-component response regulator
MLPRAHAMDGRRSWSARDAEPEAGASDPFRLFPGGHERCRFPALSRSVIKRVEASRGRRVNYRDHNALPRAALVVEDDPVMREALAGYMRDEGFDVFTAPTLGRARHCLKSCAIGVVVLDLALADGDGEPLVGYVSHMAQPPAVVVVSAHGTRAAQIASQYSVPYVTKPFELDVVGATILVAHERRVRPHRRRSRPWAN